MSASISVLGRTFDVTPGPSVGEAFRALGYNPGSFLFIVSGKPVPMDSPIGEGWKVEALKVASGG